MPPRLLAPGVMLIVGAAHALKLAGFAHPELDALLAAGLASVLTSTATL